MTRSVDGPAPGYYSAPRVRRSLGHFLVGRGVTACASVAVAVLLVRHLSVADYAGYTALSGLLMLLVIASNGGLERVVPRYFPVLRQRGAEAELRVFFWRLLGLRVALLLACLGVLALLQAQLTSWLSVPAQGGLAAAFGVYVLGFGLSLHLSRCLQSLLLQREASTGMALEWILKAAALGALLVRDGALLLTDAIWVHGVTACLGAAYMLIRLAAHLRARGTGPVRERVLDYRRVARMGLDNYLQTLAGLHTTPAAGRLLAAHLLAASATATLGFAYAVAGILRRYLPANLLIGLIEPSIMARHSEASDFRRTAELAGMVLKFNLFILAPAVAWLCLSGRPLVEWVTDGKYGEGVWLIAVLMVVLMLQSHRLVLQILANAVEQSRLLVQSNLVSLPLVLVAAAGAWAFGAAGLIGGILLILVFRDAYLGARLGAAGYPYASDWRGLGRIGAFAGLAGAGGALASAAWSEGAAGSLLACLVTASLFLALSYVWKPFTGAERATLNRVLGKPLFVW